MGLFDAIDGGGGALASMLGQYANDVMAGKYARQGLQNLTGAYQWDPNISAIDNARTMARDPAAMDQAINVAMSVGPGAIRAYHGSPYDFNKFDSSKIGTGEGAQAYGHGLYFSEHEPVARSYRDSLGKWLIGGKEANEADPTHIAAVYMKSYGNDANRAISDLMDTARLGREAERPIASKAIDLIKGNAPLPEATQSGKMYEVNISAEPEQFLNWDKPLKEQGAGVKDAARDLFSGNLDTRLIGENPNLGKLYDLLYKGQSIGTFPESKLSGGLEDAALQNFPLKGQSLYRQFGADDPAASQALRERGIPGIRYLDQGSRGAGEGTNNYTVFDDSLIEIIRKYGLAGLLSGAAGGGTLAGMMTGQANAQEPSVPPQQPYPYPWQDYIEAPPARSK